MKKLISCSLIVLLTFGAYAETPAADAAPEPIAEAVESAKDTAAAVETSKEYENFDKYLEKSAKEEEDRNKSRWYHGIQFGGGLSATSGLNGFVGYANKKANSFWWKRLGLRFDFATSAPMESTLNSEIDSALDGGANVGDGLTIDSGTFKSNHIGALVDIYPFGNTWFLGGWRLTGGYMTGKFNLAANLSGELEGAPNDPISFELDGKTYRYNGNDIHGQAKADWKYSGPYLGTGFDLGLLFGFKVYLDAGVVFTSKSAALDLDVPITEKLQFSNDGGNTWHSVEGTPAYETEFNYRKDKALAEANEDLEKLEVFPIVKLGLMYRF